ncbi:MAG: hydrolase 1, exosortase A system-associated [Novosphingobium sp.]
MRRHVTFELGGDRLVGTIDMADNASGLLIVTGGNELRCGPFGSHAELAAKLAAAGFPVMRFDRRGVGDSSGYNGGFTTSEDDIAAAVAAFRSACPRLKRIVAFGNCDGASALMLAKGHGCDALVLANPWTFDPEPEAGPEESAQPQMTPRAIRAHYLRRLADPRAVLRLLTGKVKLGQMAGSLIDAAKPAPPQSALVQTMAAGLQDFAGSVALLIAENDRTAQVFLEQWQDNDPRIRMCPDAGHSFIEPQARIWLQGQLFGALRSLR